MNKLSFHKSIISWFFLTFVVLTLIAYSNYRNFKQMHTEKAWIDHTYTVIASLNGVLSDLKDIQSAQRGYVITGQKDYLTPYSMAIPELSDKLEKLKNLVADNSLQEKRLSRVTNEANARVEIAEKIIKTHDIEGPASAFALVKEGSGKREMDQIRALVAEMIAEENHLLEMRKYKASQTTLATLKTGASGIAICTLILIIVFWLIYAESKKREETESNLQAALEHMEQANNETTMLGKLSDYMQSSQSIEEALNVINSYMPELLSDSGGAVGVFENSRNRIETMACWGLSKDNISKNFNPDQCWGLRRGKAHYFVPGGTEPCCEHFLEEPKGASLCLPMQAQGETIGLFVSVVDNVKKASKEKVAFCRRVSEQISLAVANLNLQNKLRDQSIRDPLTKAYNRRYLETTLERELSRAERNNEPLSVLVLDVDHFKKFNDTMGHDAGDALLIQFANLLQKSVRKEDMVCRYGGEEFVIVMPMASLEMATLKANKICDATRNMKLNFSNNDIKSVTVSIGVSTFPLYGMTGQDLVTAADTALYQSKQNGRDRVTAATLAIN